jgi:hypothetical protein
MCLGAPPIAEDRMREAGSLKNLDEVLFLAGSDAPRQLCNAVDE